MAIWKKTPDLPEQEDDGRTIADMSGLYGPRHKAERPVRPAANPDRPWEQESFTGSQRFWAILGAVKAGLMIGMAYIVGFGILILLLLWLWL